MSSQENTDGSIALLQGTLALQRLEDKNGISARWGVSENNRKARFYSLTPKGREQLVQKASEWQRLTKAMGLILGSSEGLIGEEA